MTKTVLFAAAAAVALSWAGAALAQPLTREELETALAQRDQEIAALEKRIAALEGGRSASATPVSTAPAAPASPFPAATAQGAAGGPADDEASLQALSRGLVERGLLLLGPWSVEVSPSVAYAHSQIQGLALVDTPEGVSVVDSQRQRDDAVEGAVTVRAGLPWRSQVQVSVPFDWKREESALGDGAEVVHSDTHVGDVQLDLSHQFLVERGPWPDVIGGLTWRIPTGSDPYRTSIASVASGIGTNSLTGRVTALKSIDPLVVYSTVSYTGNFGYRESFGTVHRGDSVGLQLGALLAVSPDTSVSFSFNQAFTQVTRVDGARIPGSDGVAGVVQVGLDQVLSSRTLLDVSLGLGVTKDAPDYVLTVSLPIRVR
jgi:hypothetical protein